MSMQAMQDVPGCPVQQHNKYEVQRTTTAVPWPAEIEARSLKLILARSRLVALWISRKGQRETWP
jgi:hypothetical protein